jgi:hypothetical protein
MVSMIHDSLLEDAAHLIVLHTFAKYRNGAYLPKITTKGWFLSLSATQLCWAIPSMNCCTHGRLLASANIASRAFPLSLKHAPLWFTNSMAQSSKLPLFTLHQILRERTNGRSPIISNDLSRLSQVIVNSAQDGRLLTLRSASSTVCNCDAATIRAALRKDPSAVRRAGIMSGSFKTQFTFAETVFARTISGISANGCSQKVRKTAARSSGELQSSKCPHKTA